MGEDLNYYVDFRADFKRPASLEEPAGEELARLLEEGLPAHGIPALKVKDGNFSYFVECLSGTSKIELMLGLVDPVDDDCYRWLVLPCAKRNFFGRKDYPESDYRQLLFAIDKTLQGCDRVEDIRWFPGFETQEYLSLMPPSPGPLRDPQLDERVHPLVRFDRRVNRITHTVLSPLGLILGIIFWVSLGVMSPSLAGYLFLSMLGLFVGIPIVLSFLIRSAARRATE